MKVNLFDIFRNAMLANPMASRKEAFKHFLEAAKSNPAYLDALAEDYFYRMAAHWEPQKVGKESYSMVATPAAKARSERSVEHRAKGAHLVTAAIKEMKTRLRDVLLLDLVLPNGKKLRDATGADCAKAGGFYTEVSRHLKPTHVVDKHLSEAELRNIQTRFEIGKRRVANAETELRA